jgi:hypothetical protein
MGVFRQGPPWIGTVAEHSLLDRCIAGHDPQHGDPPWVVDDHDVTPEREPSAVQVGRQLVGVDVGQETTRPWEGAPGHSIGRQGRAFHRLDPRRQSIGESYPDRCERRETS